jgi:hypothetical protein
MKVEDMRTHPKNKVADVGDIIVMKDGSFNIIMLLHYSKHRFILVDVKDMILAYEADSVQMLLDSISDKIVEIIPSSQITLSIHNEEVYKNEKSEN